MTSYAKSLQSPVTGFIHYHPHHDPLHTIPVVENCLFVLQLLRTKTAESMLEAKALLEKILAFQTSSGAFPTYLHEYPSCHDRYQAALILPVFYWIQKEFHSIIGPNLQAATDKLIVFTMEQPPAPEPIAIRIAASIWALKGDSSLFDAIPCQPNKHWFIPNNIAHYLTALQMVYPSIANSPWAPFWEHLGRTWHRPSQTYVGPAIKLYEMRSEPQITLYDYYMAAFTQTPAPKTPIISSILVQPTTDELRQFTASEGVLEGARYVIRHEEKFAYAMIEKVDNDNGFHPIYLVWNKKTFVMQNGNIQTFRFDGLNLTFEMKEPLPTEDREKNRELVFFTNLEDTFIKVDDQASTTFRTSQNLLIQDPTMKIQLKFLADEGDFIGHIMRGNRPSQIGKIQYEAYDWQIFLRALRRKHPQKIEVQLCIDSL